MILFILLLLLWWNKFKDLNRLIPPNLLYLFLGLVTVFPNYLLEIYKWQLLSEVIEARNFKTATKEVLRGLKLGIFTPFRAGDFLGRSMGFTEGKRSNAVLLHFFNSITQTWTALLLGSIALLLWDIPGLIIPALLLSSFTLISLALLLGLKIRRWEKYQAALDLPLPLKLKIIALSLLRTISYNLQYFFIYTAFGIDISLANLFIGANLILLLKTVGGGLNALGDLTLRQVVSMYFFGRLGIEEDIIFMATFTVWCLSILLPILWGMLFHTGKSSEMKIEPVHDLSTGSYSTPPKTYGL